MATLSDGNAPFDVTLLGPADSPAAVLFAAGRAGDPSRHLPLLQALAEQGLLVVAPRFEFLATPVPGPDELEGRARRLHASHSAFLPPSAAVTGVGHSIGASLLLALAGAALWTRSGGRVEIAPSPSLRRLALLAPALDFVQAPGALDAVALPIVAWTGTRDELVPPQRVEQLLVATVGRRAPVESRVVEGANHFSFMDVPPPRSQETLANREDFLKRLHGEIARFALAAP